MAQDTPPTDAEVLAAIADSGVAIEPAHLIGVLRQAHAMENVIEALQRGIERGKIALNAEGMIVATPALAHAA